MQIKGKTGIYYKIIGNHIIFLDKKPVSNADQVKTNSYKSLNSIRQPGHNKPIAHAPEKKVRDKPVLTAKSNKAINREYLLDKESTTGNPE
ncbi:MAG TPA: hypothetical protein VFO70_04935, partial [Chitinophagaceae bacterium]|nr:hypothetical protein [Chitinophagaceae bacterium]